MRRLILTAIGMSFACRTARSQDAGDGTTTQTLAIATGVNREIRRDATVSPLAFTGTGLGIQIDYVREHAEENVYTSLSAGIVTLGPSRSLPDPKPLDAFSTYSMVAGMRWRAAGNARRSSEFAFGAEIGADAMITRHFYVDQDQSEETFFLGVVTFGPSGRWRRRTRTGVITATLALPLVAWIQHPYADVRVANGLTKLRYEPPSQFHEATGQVSYLLHPQDRLSFAVTYRVRLLQIANLQPLRGISQTLSIGLVRRFG